MMLSPNATIVFPLYGLSATTVLEPVPEPFAPFGIPRFSTGFSVVPVIDAVADCPDSSVFTVPIVILGVTPVSPFAPGSPFSPASPLSPLEPFEPFLT